MCYSAIVPTVPFYKLVCYALLFHTLASRAEDRSCDRPNQSNACKIVVARRVAVFVVANGAAVSAVSPRKNEVLGWHLQSYSMP